MDAVQGQEGGCVAREGPFTRISAIIAVFALVMSYVIGAAPLHWWPFDKRESAQQSKESLATAPMTGLPDLPVTSSVPPSGAGREDPVQFVREYYRLMPDTAAGWEFIGPRLRLRTRESYDNFWAQFSAVEILSPPVVNGGYATVRIALYRKDGHAKKVERHVLGITSCGGHLCIDSDEVG
jgi:hypothetical protein